MTPADKPKFIKQLMGLAVIKPGKELTKEAYEIWWQAMQGWTLEDFAAGAAHLARSTEFMPSPFHFEQLRKAGRSTVGEAWTEIRAMARQSYEGEPANPAAAKALRAIGGLRAVAMCDSDKVHFLERRFAEHYEDMQDADDVREAVPQIAGDKRLALPGLVKQVARGKAMAPGRDWKGS